MALPLWGGACSSKPSAIADLAIKIDWVDPIAMAAKPFAPLNWDAIPFAPPASIASEYSTFHVILNVTNPNAFLVTAESLEAEIVANDISMGLHQTDGPIYLPAGKSGLVRLPLTLNTRVMMLEMIVGKQKATKDALKMVLDTWQDIQNGKAIVRVKGQSQLAANGITRVQNFDIRKP